MEILGAIIYTISVPAIIIWISAVVIMAAKEYLF